MKKFVVYNPTTKEYFKRGCGHTLDPDKARIYNKANHASCSLKRQRWQGDNFEVRSIDAFFPMDSEDSTGPLDTYKAVSEGATLPFKAAVDYFRQMYQMDISGVKGAEFPMCVDMIAVFYRVLKRLETFKNGDGFLITEKNFDTETPLVQMIASELLKMFGYTTQGKRVALFSIDWFDDEQGPGFRKWDY